MIVVYIDTDHGPQSAGTTHIWDNNYIRIRQQECDLVVNKWGKYAKLLNTSDRMTPVIHLPDMPYVPQWWNVYAHSATEADDST